jgi:hypothetical protein
VAGQVGHGPRVAASMRRHTLSRPPWRPPCADAPSGPPPRFHPHFPRARFSGPVHDAVRPLGRRCNL